MRKRLMSILIVLSVTVSLLSLGGCQSTDNGPGTSTDDTGASGSEPTSSANNATSLEQNNTTASIEGTTIAVALSNTYTTKFGATNAVTYPPFSFDYPDGWTITKESVTQQSETVTLENDRGAEITFSYIGGQIPGGGSAVVMQQVEVTKVADAGFIPGYVQATDYSDLGDFMVAQLKLIGTMNMQKDTGYTEVDGGVSYAVLPTTSEGIHSGLTHQYILDFSFRYAGNIALIADAPDGGFTEQEMQETIAILASFRDEDVSPNATNNSNTGATGGFTAASIDELWALLDGDWNFEDFIYGGDITIYKDHTMQFQYVDKKPCMSREYPEQGSSADEFFYDLASIDEFSYDVYTYMRGSYGGEGANWSSDVRLVWWSFDLSNLSNGELSITYNIATDNGSIDNSNTFKYSRS